MKYLIKFKSGENIGTKLIAFTRAGFDYYICTGKDNKYIMIPEDDCELISTWEKKENN